jgi:nickel/cobalt exporter
MALSLIYGASSGALHALTGPDHVLSLGPVALRHPRASFRIGLYWGIGHALGTLLLGLPALFLSNAFDLATLAAHGTRLAGLALMLTAALSLHSLSRARSAASSVERKSPLFVGLVHGVTGAASLLLVLPMVALGSAAHTLSFLVAFGVGSALAMAGLTFAIARLGQRLPARAVGHAQRGLGAAGFVLGAVFFALH